MGLFRKTKTTKPLSVPRYSEFPLPDVPTMKRKSEDSVFILDLAYLYAKEGQFDEQGDRLARVVAGRFFSDDLPTEGRDAVHSALVASAKVGLGLAEAETEELAGENETSLIVHNSICQAVYGIGDVPDEMKPMMAYVIRLGYYVGKRGESSTEMALSQM